MLTNFKVLLFFIIILLSIILDKFINCPLDLLLSVEVSFLLNCGISLQSFDLAITVSSQTFNFCTLPIFFEGLNNFQHKTFLIITEFTVLSKSIKTYYEFFFSTNERRIFDCRPFSLLFFKRFIGCLSSLHLLNLFVLKNVDFLLKLRSLLGDILEVTYCSF
jgi:hypothetical protein